jgi:hypothetical protein
MALSSFINPLAHIRGGLLTLAAHFYADFDQPRRFYYLKTHPERDPSQKADPTIKDKAIYMAAAVAEYSIAQVRRPTERQHPPSKTWSTPSPTRPEHTQTREHPCTNGTSARLVIT